MKFTKREVGGIFLALIVGLIALGAWQAFFLAITVAGASNIWTPIVWFAVLAAFFFLGTIVWTNVYTRIAGAVLVFLPGLFFIHAVEYALAGGIAATCLYWSSVSVMREEQERTRFHFFKNVRAGSFLFVMGLSLLLASGYYISLKSASWDELVPRFQIGEEMTRAIFKVAGIVNPSFAKVSEGDTTVDEFLMSLEQSKRDDSAAPQMDARMQNARAMFGKTTQLLSEQEKTLLTAQSQKIAEEVFLNGGREQIASLVGRPVAGDEKISDVLSVALQTKLITFLSGGKATEHVASQAIPFFLSLLLFITLLSFTSLLAPLCILAAQGLFLLSLWMGWLKLGKVMVEQERLIE